MPSPRYRRIQRKSDNKTSVFVNPKITNIELTFKSDVVDSTSFLLTKADIDKIKQAIKTSQSPNEIITFYDTAIEYIYDIFDMIIEEVNINTIISYTTNVQRYINDKVAEYNVYSELYTSTYFFLDIVRNITISIIQNLIDGIGFDLINGRIEYLKGQLESIRQDM